MNYRLLLLLALAGGDLLFCPSRGQGQVEPGASPLPAAPQPKPTTTEETGDRGGKYFGKVPDPAKSRRYYIAAEPELWDYAPQGKDLICGMPLPPNVVAKRSGLKLRYVQYTDASFQARVIPNPQLGVMGPALRGMVGETLVVTFLNRTDRPLSMHPHGVRYDRDSEGAYTEPNPGLGAAVGPGAKFTYVWELDEQSSPLPSEPSSKAWLYHSHVHGDEEALLGLVGSIIVTDPQRARADGTPKDVDREMAALFMIFDESGLDTAIKEAVEHGVSEEDSSLLPSWMETQQMLEQGARFAINGYIFGNLPGLEMNEGDRVRWYLFGLGSEDDLHTAHWHGMRVIEEGRRRTDVVELLPASMKVADMRADNPGTWLFHCHVAEHMMNGMFARMIVHPKDSPGVSRAPEAAFLGLDAAQKSLLISRAQVHLDFSPNASTPCELKLNAVVSVQDGFSVFAQDFAFQIGERSVTFHPDASGLAKKGRDTLRVLNSGSIGVVYGGLLEFEIQLHGVSWLEELRKLGVLKDKTLANDAALLVTLTVGEIQHTAKARISR